MSAPSFVSLADRLGSDIDQWRIMLWDVLCDLRVAMPCEVVSYDSAKQTVVLQPLIRENLNINAIPTPTQIPNLLDVPVVWPRAGGFAITFPIEAGDECLAVFADCCYNAWWASGGVQNQEERRRHDLSDAFAVFGIWNQKRVLSSPSASSLQLRTENGDTYIDVSHDQITITPNGGVAKISINSGEINLTAPVVNINGHSYAMHEHTGVTTGGGFTGGVKAGT